MKLPDHKSKVGIGLAGLYMLLLIWTSVEIAMSPPMNFRMSLLVYLFILTAPGIVAPFVIFGVLGLFKSESANLFIFICAFIGGVINTLSLYFLGYLLTRMFVSIKKAVWDK